MTSVRLAYVFVVIFAATLHFSGVVVCGMENFDTALIENSVPTNAGLDSSIPRRLRGTVQEDPVNEERAVPISAKASWAKDFDGIVPAIKFSGMLEKARLNEQMKILREWMSKHKLDLKTKLKTRLKVYKTQKEATAEKIVSDTQGGKKLSHGENGLLNEPKVPSSDEKLLNEGNSPAKELGFTPFDKELATIKEDLYY